MLRARDKVPRIGHDGQRERLLLFPADETSGGIRGRPMDPGDWSVADKLRFMDAQHIDISALSLGNPWLDFLDPKEAKLWASQLNEDMAQLCAQHPARLLGLGVLPTQDPDSAVQELRTLTRLPGMRGFIVSTVGAGKGLDDPALEPLWETAEETNMLVLVHPHYGIDMATFGDYAWQLNMGLGFLFETTIAVSRLIFAGVPTRFPDLKIYAPHAGGTLPYVAGRLDRTAVKYRTPNMRLEHPPSHYLRRLYYDVTCFHAPAVACAVAFANADHLMFGTDHPFVTDPAPIHAAIADLPPSQQEAIRNGTARFALGL